MNYIAITSPHPRKFYVARRLLGGGYSIIATCTNDIQAKEIASAMALLDQRRDQLTFDEKARPQKKKAA